MLKPVCSKEPLVEVRVFASKHKRTLSGPPLVIHRFIQSDWMPHVIFQILSALLLNVCELICALQIETEILKRIAADTVT